MGVRALITGLVFVVGFSMNGAQAKTDECVILLHGLARTAASMQPLEQMLESAGYHVVNRGYPSRKETVDLLAMQAVEAALAECQAGARVHFVTHSLGGILVRAYLHTKRINRLGRVVMLAPPNQGSEVVDTLRSVPGFSVVNGPAGLELGTDADSVPARLGPVDFELGVVAGTRSVNLLLSLLLPNPDDGKVSVESARVAGMADFVTVPSPHPFIMRSKLVHAHILHFLGHGRFAQRTEAGDSEAREHE
jgi:pimeloyl-ACP methyl ester carboxylesterase